MFYYLFNYLEKFDFPGAGLFHYISFRSGMAFLCALLISIIIGKKIIEKLRGLQIKETIRDLGLHGECSKVGTPTMGGIIIIIAILIPTLLFAKIGNVYIILMIITTIWLGFIGFLDDYIKVLKKNKAGLGGKFKIIGQVGLGIIVASILYMSDQVVVRTYEKKIDPKTNQVVKVYKDVKSTETTLPFIKKNSVNYSDFLFFLGDAAKKWGWLVFLLGVVFIITAVSNGSNLTDGIDGLAAGSSAIIGAALGVLAYVSGNAIFSNYLNIMHLPNIGELSIFISAFMGATIGFMWYNFYPAQIFMGDTGSLTLGGIIAVCAIVLRKELLLPIICGIFLVESLSVMMQVSYFKYTKKKYGEGRRIFLMSPLHHHFQKKGTHEAKITIRFLLIGAVLATIAILTLKVR